MQVLAVLNRYFNAASISLTLGMLAQGDLDWNMEHLNEAEMKLLTSVLAEDGVHHSQSVVVSPKKERCLEDDSRYFPQNIGFPASFPFQ